MAKSPDAFRTISEVSAWLETPPHVLRFWESKFPQVKPVKRAGGRRYYRPEDIALLGGIKVLLHEQGMTIRGVQKMLREQGVRHVASLSAQVWAEDGAGEAGLEEISDADLDVALGDEVDGDDAEEPDEVANGVIVGPWAGRDDDREVDAAEEDEPYLAALDGLRAEGALADEAAADARGRDGAEGGLAARGPEAGSDARVPTLIEGFLAGTASRFAAGADRGSAPPARAALPPLPPGEPTLERALALLRRADPDRLHARADRIAPLLQRLKRLREGLPHRSA